MNVPDAPEAKAFEPPLKPSAVRQWVYDDVEGFAARYAHARDLGIEAMADEMFDIVDEGSNDLMPITKGDAQQLVWTTGSGVCIRSWVRR